MMRIAYLTLASVALFGLLPAAAQNHAMDAPDPMAALMTDCDVPSLEDAKVDSCLERARVMEETNPSPGIEALQAKLEQRSVQRFDPNSLAPPTTEGNGAMLDNDANQTTPPAKMLNSTEANSADVPPVQDSDDDGAKAPVRSDSKMDDGDPPDTNTDDPPPPDPKNVDPPAKNDDPPG